MKKTVLSLLAVAAAVLVVSGCASVPQFTNMTGQWKYSYVETGKKEVETGAMTLKQDCFKLSGQANDAHGEFALTGNLNGIEFVLDGMRNDNKRSFKINASLDSENSFSGKYTTDQNTSGEIFGSRIISK